MIKLTGIADEAGAPLEIQIKAHQELGWDSIESRMIEIDGVKGNLHEVPEATFDQACELLQAANMHVSGFGSIIANWAHHIEDDFAITTAQIDRAIPRMQKLGTSLIRIMSYAVRKGANGEDHADQMEAERIVRLKAIKQRFDDAGLTVIHENCMNWGGMAPSYVKRVQDAIPDLKWVFDTGNPVIIADRDKPGQRQDAWEMYQVIKPSIAHIHIKDAIYNPGKGDGDYKYPGEGDGQVERICADLIASNYQGYISIEPHVAVVFHGAGTADNLSPEEKAREQYESYTKYGRQMEALLRKLQAPLG